MPEFHWEDVPLLEPGSAGYWECDATGFSMMVAWFAGPYTLRKLPDERVQMMQVTDRRGTRSEPMDADWAQDIHDAINDFLEEVGIRPQPPGFRWFQVVPSGLGADDVYAAAIDEQARIDSRFPADSANAIRRAIQGLYRPGR